MADELNFISCACEAVFHVQLREIMVVQQRGFLQWLKLFSLSAGRAAFWCGFLSNHLTLDNRSASLAVSLPYCIPVYPERSTSAAFVCSGSLACLSLSRPDGDRQYIL
jgi:hypothetical protein